MSEEQKKKDILRHMSKLWTLAKDYEDELIPEGDRKGFMDPANVCMVIPKKKKFLSFLKSTFVLSEPQKVPKLDFKGDGTASVSTYSCEYIRVLLEMAKHDDSVRLSLKADYPLKAETEDFVFVLAPRVSN